MPQSELQKNLFEPDDSLATGGSKFSDIYSDKKLGKLLDGLESRYGVTDEVSTFASLVNPSISKRQPYHRWARYREAYAGEIVKEIINRITIEPGTDLVIDPMCGSGSTNVACKEIGIDSLGLDVNGYSVLLSNAKLEHYSSREIEEIERLVGSYQPMTGASPEYFKDVAKYFDAMNLSQLERIGHWWSSIEQKKIRSFFVVAWLAIIEDCSNRKKDGNGLATRRSKISDVFGHFDNQVLTMLSDLKEYPLARDVFGLAVQGSALKMSKYLDFGPKNKKVGAIIFSPPYANSFDYFESYKLELVMGGFVSFSNLREARKSLIRNYRLNSSEAVSKEFDVVERICGEIWEAIPVKEKETGIRDGRTRLVPNMLRCYFDDMYKALADGYKTLRNAGTMSIVVDQSAYLGLPIPTDIILALIGEEIGFHVKGLIKCRRAGTSGQQLKKFPYLKEILRESIVILEKI